MSLSKVIKSGNSGDRSVTSFCFNNFQGRAETSFHGAEGFTPFLPGCDRGPLADAIPEPVTETPPVEAFSNDNGMVMISGEELEERIDEAYAKGIEEERRQADEDLSGICSALAEAVSIVSRLRERIVKESEEELLKLSFMVAKKIIRQEIKQDRQIMGQIVSETLREFPEQHDIVVCLHPEDYKVISSNREFFLAGVGNDRQITFKPDEAMTAGGCVVESSTGLIDARIEAQLDEIYKSLIEERNILCDMQDVNAPTSRPDKELLP
jgi:flagellar assembly protein FliH